MCQAVAGELLCVSCFIKNDRLFIFIQNDHDLVGVVKTYVTYRIRTPIKSILIMAVKRWISISRTAANAVDLKGEYDKVRGYA